MTDSINLLSLSVNRVETPAFQAGRFQQEIGLEEPPDEQVAGNPPGRYDRGPARYARIGDACELSKNGPFGLRSEVSLGLGHQISETSVARGDCNPIARIGSPSLCQAGSIYSERPCIGRSCPPFGVCSAQHLGK